MNPTRRKLLDATAEVLRHEGIAAVSARGVATRAGVNQALVFYHFGSLDGMLDAACRDAVGANVDSYRDRFATVTTLRELLDVGRRLHERERAAGNVAMMAQLMAGAQHDSALVGALRDAMALWNAEIEAVIRRVLVDNPLAELVDAAGMAQAISSGFLGLELYEGIDPDGATAALDALEQLGVLVEVVADLGPVARRALRARLRRLGK